MSLPIDTSKVKFLTGDDVKPQIVYETGEQKTTRDGQPIYLVPVVAFPVGGAAEILPVKVLGQPKGLQPHSPVARRRPRGPSLDDARQLQRRSQLLGGGDRARRAGAEVMHDSRLSLAVAVLLLVWGGTAAVTIQTAGRPGTDRAELARKRRRTCLPALGPLLGAVAVAAGAVHFLGAVRGSVLVCTAALALSVASPLRRALWRLVRLSYKRRGAELALLAAMELHAPVVRRITGGPNGESIHVQVRPGGDVASIEAHLGAIAAYLRARSVQLRPDPADAALAELVVVPRRAAPLGNPSRAPARRPGPCANRVRTFHPPPTGEDRPRRARRAGGGRPRGHPSAGWRRARLWEVRVTVGDPRPWRPLPGHRHLALRRQARRARRLAPGRHALRRARHGGSDRSTARAAGRDGGPLRAAAPALCSQGCARRRRAAGPHRHRRARVLRGESRQEGRSGLHRAPPRPGGAARAAGIVVVAATQKPSADLVPSALRDLFGFRLAHRCTTREASDTILGGGWASKGASAADIDPALRGVGYLLAEGGVPRRFRTFRLEDDEIAAIASRAVHLREGGAQ